MRLGQAAMEALRAEITGCLQPGDELAVVCPVGAERNLHYCGTEERETGRAVFCRVYL